jgi:calmodulin
MCRQASSHYPPACPPAELDQLFLALGHNSKRGEVGDMIWEVDEDCDGCISWLEFQNLYTRGRDDKTGYEPRGLFNVVEFVMNDKEGAGFITLEEAMQIMYLRYGRCVVHRLQQTRIGNTHTHTHTHTHACTRTHTHNAHT